MIPRRGASAPVAAPGQLGERDVAGLVFVGEMYGTQLDQLGTLLGMSEQRASGFALRWRRLGYAESARLGPGRQWT